MLALTQLAVRLQEKLSLDEMLALVVDHAARAIEAPQISLRLLDVTRTRLLVTARAGRSVHSRGDVSFRVGEGLVGWVAERGLVLRTDAAGTDPRFAPRADVQLPVCSFVGVPLIASGHVIGVLSSAHADAGRYTEAHEQTLVLVAAICAPHLEVARLERLANVDPLTGALNRRGLDDVLDTGRAAPPFAVAMADLDLFKQVNDEHGHAVGDEVLQQVVSAIALVVRAGDAVVRWGGEELLLALPGAGLAQALAVAERARAVVEASRVPTPTGPVRVTVSMGVASMREGESFEAMVERADQALYRAKELGRNRVEGEASR